MIPRLWGLVFPLFFFPLSFLNAQEYTAGRDFFYKDGQKFVVKGVVYVPVYPGFVPWELAQAQELPDWLKQNIRRDIQDIKAMGANTIRFWDVPVEVYRAVREIGGLAIIQTVWFDAQQRDLQDPAFKQKCKTTIKTTVDRIYEVYSREDPPPLLAFLAGSELSRKSIEETNRRHSGMPVFKGRHVHAPENASPAENFLAEMADYFKSYELEKYGHSHLVSYANEIRTETVIDTPFLDFRSFNAYSYAVSDFASPKEGSRTKTIFQGWIEELKNRVPEKPLLITETGLSVSPRAARLGPPDYGYGGNTLEDQARGLVQNWNDLVTAEKPVAGGVIHEYLDAWWKYGLKDSYEHEPEDIEEWFGLASIEKQGEGFRTEFRPAYEALKVVWKEDRSKQ